jgi:hypothetical protein
VAHLGTVNLFSLSMGYLGDVTVTAHTGYRPVDRLMKKLSVNIVILEGPLFVINPEPSVFVTEQTILGITCKGDLGNKGKKHN